MTDKNKIKICLDAGHYGHKYNHSPVVPAYYESEMNWKLHLLLKTELEAYGIEVITTRPNQEGDLDLFSRGAKSKGCILFISLHSNACATESNDYPIAICLLDDKKIEIDDESRRIGDMVIKVVQNVMGTSQVGRIGTRQSAEDRDGNGILDDEYYGVLNGAKQVGTPGMIIEHSFHTNTRSAKWLLDDANLKKLAQAEGAALAAYYGLRKDELADNATSEKIEENHNLTREEFINFVGTIAQKDWKERKICLPSVVIAQAMKESALGKSELAQYANALFGIKKNGWTGPIYIKKATEQNADGSYSTVNNVEWRKYNSWEESILDHNTYLATRMLAGQIEPNFKAIIGETDFRKAVAALQGAQYKYATSLTYADSLNNDYILKYDLTRFDAGYEEEEQTPSEPVTERKTVLYRVQVGAFNTENMAAMQKSALESKGIKAELIKEDGKFKVQAGEGLYKVKANADALLQIVTNLRFDAFIKVIQPTVVEPKEITVGSTVTVLKNVTYTGNPFRVYYDKYDVIAISGDRVVIGIGNVVTCAIHKENVALA